jgi:transposase InsO family protein
LEKKRLWDFQGFESRSSFSNIWDNKTSILLSKKKTKQGRVCSINTFYTDSYGRKFPMILLPKKASSPGFRHRLWLSKNEALQIKGYNINHKYIDWWKAQLLQEKTSKPSKTRVKYRKVFQVSSPEMDIKFVWVEEYKMHCYVLTTIDTFTHIVLHWMVAYSIKKQDVKRAWEHIIINHLPNNCLERELILRFAMIMIVGSLQSWFRNFLENYLNQVFTHPYTPENGHIESFHAILAKNYAL